ncbi:MAG: serine/threonine protein kinase, partial [Deltaproteobacteria bacterium]|nr:serine/threonine protein kinase [Kofleriaceae bacterium]
MDTIAARVCGRLGGRDRQRVERHLGDCAPCRDLAAALAGSVLSRLPAKVAGATALLSAGTGVGRYRVTRLLGAGGMGVVYAAHDPELGRDVAVKVLHPLLAEDPAAARAFLLAEARAMARLRHPNVVAVYDAGAFGDQVYVAMELIAGQTLRDWLAVARPWRQVLDVMRAAGRGLAAAHAAGLVHRDFKPENVLIGGSGEVCVSDFGIALHAGTGDGELAGTPMYMAPEQRAGAWIDARADQYAFALVLCEALTGLRPDQSFDVIRPPRDRAFPSWLRRACARALSPSPEARFPSMDALLDRLDRRAVQLRRGAVA